MEIWESGSSKPKSSYWKASTAFFTAGFEVVWGAFFTLFPKLLQMVWNSVTDFFSNVETAAWNRTFRFYRDSGAISDEDYKQLLKLKDLAWPMDKLLYFYVTMFVAKDYFELQRAPGVEIMRQNVNKQRRPGLPHYGDIMNAAFVAPEKTGEVKEILKKHGFKDDDIDLLFLSRYRLYNEFDIRTLYLRGILDTDQMFMRMRELGYTDTRTQELVESWEVIPPPSDLITMVAKEAFEPDFIKKIGLDAEFPTEQVEWLNKQGISTEWAKKYWYAHWNEPSVQMGMEMLHRDVIDDSELDMLFRAQEIPPYWREKLKEIAYAPYTRVDIRRMHKEGVVNDEELIRAYKDIGYDDEKAMNLAIFTLKYNTQDKRELTRSQIVSSFADSMVSRGDATLLLVDLGYSEAEADYMLTYEEWKRDLDYQEQIIKNIKAKFIANLITSFDANKLLNEQNLPAERVAILMDRWEVERYRDIKLPSKTDLDKLYRNKIINQDEYYVYMKRLGYSHITIGWYETLIQKKKAG